MHRRSLLAGVAVGLAGCSEGVSGPDARAAETQIRAGINDLRAEATVPDLPSEPALATAAREHSRDMHERDYYAHESPDGRGPSDRAGCRAGEVIHRGEVGEMRNQGGDGTWNTFATDELAAYVVEGWRLSESHYTTLIDPRWRAIGVGVSLNEGTFFATAVLC